MVAPMKHIRIIQLLPLFCILTLPSLAYADAIIMTKAMTASTVSEIFGDRGPSPVQRFRDGGSGGKRLLRRRRRHSDES